MQEIAREEKAITALAIMAAVLVPVIMNLVPIYIAVVIGAAVMVLTNSDYSSILTINDFMNSFLPA